MLLFSRSVMSSSLWPHELQHVRLPCPSPTPGLLKLMSIESVKPSNHLILCRPLLLLFSIFPSIRVFSSESVLCIRWPKYWSSSLSISLPMNIQDWFPLGWTGWVSLLSNGLSSLLQHHSSKASFLQPLSLPYSPTLTTIHDHWKNHSFDYTDLCWQGNVSAF